MADDLKHILTREMLRDGSVQRMIAESTPHLRLLTDQERADSLDRVMAQRPPGSSGAWLFAYGSLIWNPALPFETRRVARVHGWHRSFCLSTMAGRGTVEQPGLVLGLDRGGACTGAAFLIAEDNLAEELPILWRREMLSGSYQPRWVAVRGPDGAVFGHAIAFTIHRQAETYAGNLAEEEVVRRLATARGALGSAAEYLFHTRDGLQALGISDKRIERLARQVEQALKPATK